jgi:hypothetical protein
MTDDPRIFPDAAAAPADAMPLHHDAHASLTAETGAASAAHDARIGAVLDAWLARDDGRRLADAFATAPSPAIHRHLWRLLAERERAGAPDPARLLRPFAIPVIVVAGLERTDASRIVVPGIVDAAVLEGILREHRALAGHGTLALGNALAGADALEIARLPTLLRWGSGAEPAAGPRAVEPSPIVVEAGSEGVYLRFLVGTVLAAPGADPLRDPQVGAWGLAFARALDGALAIPGLSLLALPRAPQRLTTALWQGRVAQREVSAQIFASNAIRKLRAATGEPSAVISVHRLDAPAGAGEVRLSLSSPFDPRDAEGFRCPLWPLDRVDDVVQMLAELLADCRVVDVRILPGVHGDRVPGSGLPLLFKGAELPPPAAVH